MDRIALTESIAGRWNEAGIVYAIAHGIDAYPARLGRDVDVVVRARDVPSAIAIARDVLERRGLIVACPPPLWGDRLLAADREEPDELLEIHTLTRITWRNTVVVEHPIPSKRVGPFAVDPWIALAKRVVLPMLGGDTSIFTADPARLAIDGAERGAASPRLAALMGPALATRLLAAADAADLGAIESLAPRIRRAVLLRSAVMHPMRAAGLLRYTTMRRIRQPFSPCAPIVAVVGAPGVDTRAALQAIVDGDRLIFTDLVVRRDGARSSLARALRDRLDSSRQRLVIYDGYPASGARASLPERVAAAIGAPLRRIHLEPDLTIVVGDGAAPSDAVATSDGVPARASLSRDLDVGEMRRRAVALIIHAFITRNQHDGPRARPDDRSRADRSASAPRSSAAR